MDKKLLSLFLASAHASGLGTQTCLIHIIYHARIAKACILCMQGLQGMGIEVETRTLPEVEEALQVSKYISWLGDGGRVFWLHVQCHN